MTSALPVALLPSAKGPSSPGPPSPRPGICRAMENAEKRLSHSPWNARPDPQSPAGACGSSGAASHSSPATAAGLREGICERK
jgi:hypothetical protein